jgi:hypothetical protein
MRSSISKVTARLERVVRRLSEDEESWGPKGAEPSFAADASSAGDGGAVNTTSANDALDLYLAEIADLCALEYDMEDSDSEALIYDTADMLGIPIPDEGTSDEDAFVWIGTAKTKAFAQAVLKRAQEMSTEDEEEEVEEGATRSGAPISEAADDSIARVDNAVSSVIDSAAAAQKSWNKYKSDPGKYKPQLHNVRQQLREVEIAIRGLSKKIDELDRFENRERPSRLDVFTEADTSLKAVAKSIKFPMGSKTKVESDAITFPRREVTQTRSSNKLGTLRWPTVGRVYTPLPVLVRQVPQGLPRSIQTGKSTS